MVHLLLIDAMNLIRRIYAVQERPYAPLADEVADTTKAQIVTNTEQTLRQSLLRLQQELKPSHAALVFDGQSSYWRRQLFADYKANRKPMPSLLADALPRLQLVAKELGFVSLQQQDYEADDIIASIATRMAKHQQQVTIASTDKGFLPLLSQQIQIYDTFNRQYNSSDSIHEKFGVQPSQLVRYWSLVGDSTNNIPGVPGIGPKTALEILALANTFSQAVQHESCHKKTAEKLIQHKADILVFMQILSLKTDVEMGINLQELRLESNLA